MNEQQATEVQIRINLSNLPNITVNDITVTDDRGNQAVKTVIDPDNPMTAIRPPLPITICVAEHASPGWMYIEVLGIPFRIPIPQ